jgi:hypothetical protein
LPEVMVMAVFPQFERFIWFDRQLEALRDEIREEVVRMNVLYRLPGDPGRILPDEDVGSEQH